jgi:hypothetical protein
MNPISIAYLGMVIVGFMAFAVTLFSVHLYVNAKGYGRRPAPRKAEVAEAPTDFRRAA